MVTLEDGKYQLEHDETGYLRALRYGEPWRDLTGDKLVLALVQRIEELEAVMGRSEIERLRDAQAKAVAPLIGPMLDAWDGVPNDLKDELFALHETIGAIADMMENHP